jgi:hypothetical protein
MNQRFNEMSSFDKNGKYFFKKANLARITSFLLPEHFHKRRAMPFANAVKRSFLLGLNLQKNVHNI